MEIEDGTPALAPLPGDVFDRAYQAFVAARFRYREAKAKVEASQADQVAAISELPEEQRSDMAQLETVADEVGLSGVAHEAWRLMCEADAALEAMMRIEAPTIQALFLKLEAITAAEWAIGDHLARLTADAGTLSFQFAEVWLARFRGHGGEAMLDRHNDGRLAIFIPCFSLSHDYAEMKARHSEAGLETSDEQQGWHAAFYDGKMRELSDLLDEVPGARAALKAMLEGQADARALAQIGEGE